MTLSLSRYARRLAVPALARAFSAALLAGYGSGCGGSGSTGPADSGSPTQSMEGGQHVADAKVGKSDSGGRPVEAGRMPMEAGGMPTEAGGGQADGGTDAAPIAVGVAPTGPGTVWFVRPDGGTRFSSNVPMGQCDGMADAAYPGTGVNQHCAFNDVRYLWSDATYSTGTTFPGWGWIGKGGDTYFIRGTIASKVSYRIGWNSASTYCDGSVCFGLTGNPYGSGAPPPPSGTASQHTRILGENYAACHDAAAKTQLHGGWAVDTVLSLSGSSYVDLSCLDITDFSACGRASQKVGCDATQDFAQVGIGLYSTSTYITLDDIHIHGMAAAGIAGPPGTGFVANYLDLLGNASSGWNADPGDGTTGVGTLDVTHFDISWNGCAEEYPVVDAVPYGDCTDDSSGGYGDGFGTTTAPSPAPGWQVHFDQGLVSYNTQDGLDALHIGGPGSTMTATRVLAYGNQGQQLKVGGATATIQNSVVVGNCEAMTTQTIPGTPTGFGSALADPCRAGNTAVLINVTPGDPAVFQFNTVFESGAIGLEVEYATSDTGPGNTLKFNDNVFVGFLDSASSKNGSTLYSNTDLNMLTNPGASWTNNATYHQNSNWTCPAMGETNAVCGDPGLVDETYHAYGYGNMAPTANSALLGKGVSIPGITTDYLGTSRKNPPTIGAYE